MIDAHDVRVVVLLSASEYISMKAMANDDGFSMSALVRHLIKLEAGRRVLKELSDANALADREGPAQVLHT